MKPLLIIAALLAAPTTLAAGDSASGAKPAKAPAVKTQPSSAKAAAAKRVSGLCEEDCGNAPGRTDRVNERQPAKPRAAAQ